MLSDLPFELLSDIVERLVGEYLYEYFLSHGSPKHWNAISVLNSVSVPLRAVVHTLLASSLAIPRLEDGRLSRDPLFVISLARNDADARFHKECRHEESDSDTEPAMPQNDSSEATTAWWKASPLLELYSVIREMRLKCHWIAREGRHLHHIIHFLEPFRHSMDRADTAADKRLVRPALDEAVYVWAAMTLVGLLAVYAWWFENLSIMLEREPERTYMYYDEFEQGIGHMEEAVESGMTNFGMMALPTKLVHGPRIFVTNIVPAMRHFLNLAVVASDPRLEHCRRRVEVLLEALEPLDHEIYEEILKKNRTHDRASMIFDGLGCYSVPPLCQPLNTTVNQQPSQA
ncbi:hypothetical protein JB92DRAFT_2919921 [Gautieria morchelliformis]|nr:hypothetical protein JB92DRAFT_2919921 [Gautieria morchelliformis]